jgi:hypothetical protein
MRRSFPWLIGLSLLLLPLTAEAALAESGVRSQTTQITVVSDRCLPFQLFCTAPTVVNRSLTLQSSSAKSIQGFRLIPTDLERKDNAAVIPAQWVTASIDPATQLAPQKFLSLPVQVDLRQVSRSGEYSGTLFVEHSEGNVAVPITLRIKDSSYLAIAFLVSGVALALMLSLYQAEGFDRDEISVQMGQLRSQMRTEESEPVKIFQAKAEAALVDVNTALLSKSWAEARKSFGEAQATWNRWRKQRNAWLDLYDYIDEALAAYLGDPIPLESIAGKDLNAELKRVRRELADYDTPQKFAEMLKPLKEQVQDVLAARATYEQLNQLRMTMKADGDRWQTNLVALDEQANQIALEDRPGWQNWQSAAEQLKQQMQETAPVGFRGDQSAAPSLRSVPTLLTAIAPEEQRARDRLQLYRWAGHGVSILLLSWVGFNQLYNSNPTFGANAIADYSALLAWGFTAEATRDSVAKVLQRFRLPGAGGN